MYGFLWNKEQKERRKSYRRKIEARVDISHSHFGTLHGMSRDISDSGMFVKMRNAPRIPKGAHLRVVLPDSANPEIIFNMRVIRITEEGMGMVFVDYEQNGERYQMDKLLEELGKKKSTTRK